MRGTRNEKPPGKADFSMVHGRPVSRILSSPDTRERIPDNGRPSIWDRRCRRPLASYQTCSCTRQGFPRRRSRGCPAWALTPRFQPYPARGNLSVPLEASPPLALGFGRCVFCFTFPRLGADRDFSSFLGEMPVKPYSRSSLATTCFLGVAARGVSGLSSPALFLRQGRPSGRP